MPQLTHRTQVLLDESRHERLRLRAQRTGSSIGELVREAIDVAYPDPTDGLPATQAEAAAALLVADPIVVEDWPAMKRLRDTPHEEHVRE